MSSRLNNSLPTKTSDSRSGGKAASSASSLTGFFVLEKDAVIRGSGASLGLYRRGTTNLRTRAPILDFTVEQHLQEGFTEQAQQVIIRGATLALLFQRHVFGGLHPFLNEIDAQLALEKHEFRHIGVERMERLIDEALAESQAKQSGENQ